LLANMLGNNFVCTVDIAGNAIIGWEMKKKHTSLEIWIKKFQNIMWAQEDLKTKIRFCEHICEVRID